MDKTHLQMKFPSNFQQSEPPLLRIFDHNSKTDCAWQEHVRIINMKSMACQRPYS